MRTKLLAGVLLLVCLGASFEVQAAGKRPGKFYIVGMGAAPDLVTVRGQEIARRADLILLESKGDLKAWGKLVGKKPVLYAPHLARVFYGTDPATLTDPDKKALAEKNDAIRRELADKVRKAVEAGKTVAYLQWGDAMVYGNLYLLEMLPPEVPSEVIPGVGAFQAGSAALKRSTVFGWDTNGVILTMGDWPGRADTNDKLMAAGSSMVFYSMHLDYPALFAQLAQAYPAETPVAVVSYAGDPKQQRIDRSSVGKFLEDVDWAALPPEMHTLFVGKFLAVGQARKDGVIHGKEWILKQHGDDTPAP
jgi:precorrin-4/cobalt-precorrin-4 C11-methyltransferase